MINNFKNIGRKILENDNYFDENDQIEKRKLFLKYFTLVPLPNFKKKNEEIERIIVLNFDTYKKEIWFELGKEIDKLNRGCFFAFSLMGNGKKQFASTNNIEDFYCKFFSESLELIESKRKQSWFNENISKKYDSFLMNIKESFYKQNNILNEKLLEKSQKDIYNAKLKSVEDEKEKLSEELKKQLSVDDRKKLVKRLEELNSFSENDFFNYLINKLFFRRDSKASDIYPSICMIKIDNKMFHEKEEIRESYLNFCYYTIFEKSFQEKKKGGVCCSVCSNKTIVLGTVSFPYTSFYGTTNQLNFENLTKPNAYKSFSICKKCYRETLIGMKYVENELRDKIFYIDTLLIPKYGNNHQDITKTEKRVFKLFRQEWKSNQEEMKTFKKMLNQADKNNFSFDLMFYEKKKAQFDVIKLISNIEYKSLLEEMVLFEELAKTYNLPLINQRLDWDFIYYSLFPSKLSYSKVESKFYRKDILNLLDKFINKQSINYGDLVGRFVEIFNKKYYKVQSIKNKSEKKMEEYQLMLTPFKIVLILKVFNVIKLMTGVKKMNGNAVTKVQNEKYFEFFKTHKEIYEENYYRQGLFLLGTVINKIIYAQKDKTSSFIKKINLKGFPVRRVNSLVLEVQEYVQIYKDKVFEEVGIWGNIMDRLQGIENSDLTPAEVVFYILTGISFAKYDAIITKKLKENENVNNQQKQ